MRILHILADNVFEPTGGLGVAVDEITRGQRELGHETSLLFFDRNIPKFREGIVHGRKMVQASIAHHGEIHGDLQYHRFVNDGMRNSLAYAFGKDEFDLIHLHDSLCWPTADMARHLFKCPAVLTIHLSFAIENAGKFANWNTVSDHDYQTEATALAECEVTTVSRNYAIELFKHYPLVHMKPDQPFGIIPNGIRLDTIDNAVRQNVRQICGEKTPVYFCGRMVHSKGIELILGAADQLPDHHFMLFANLAPHCEDLNPLTGAVKAAEVCLDNVTWFKNFPLHGQFGYLKGAAMALVPSINPAPFEITGLEAMAAGTPLITTASCGMKEYCNTSNCTIIEPTVESLVAAIKNHSRDEGKLSAARKTAETFSWDKSAAEYVQFYERVLSYEQRHLSA